MNSGNLLIKTIVNGKEINKLSISEGPGPYTVHWDAATNCLIVNTRKETELKQIASPNGMQINLDWVKLLQNYNRQFAVVKVNLKNASQAEIEYSSSDFKLADWNGKIRGDENIMFSVFGIKGFTKHDQACFTNENYLDKSVSLLPNGMDSGLLIYPIPQGNGQLKLIYKPNTNIYETIDLF